MSPYSAIYFSFVLLPLIIGLFYVDKKNKLPLYFLGFISFTVLFEIITAVIAASGIKNYFMFTLFLICDFLFFIWYYKKHILYAPWFRYLNIFMLLLITYDIINSSITRNPLYPELYFITALFLYFIIQNLYCLLSLSDDLYFLNNPIFWISSGRLFYYICVFSVFMCKFHYPTFSNVEVLSKLFLIINALGNIVCYIMFSVSFLCKKIRI